MTERMGSGAFAAGTRLSRKALRLYEEQGLVRPAGVDERTGEVTEDSDGPVEVCVPFTGSVEPAGELGVRLEPAHTEAYTRITRAQVRFPEILKAYHAVSDWLEQQGHKPAMSPREVYFTDFTAAADDDPACDIAWPYAVASTSSG